MFGGFELGPADHPPMPLGSARIATLLAYLVLHRSPQSRQRIAFLLWPDSTEPQARTNLRHLLHELKRSIPDVERVVEIGAHALRWREDTPARVDVDEFEHAL